EDVRVNLGVEISLWDKPEVVAAPEAKTQVVEVVKTTGLEDSDGDGIVDSNSYNQKLSEKRANAVRQYLMQAGISGDNMTAAGYGEKEPIATNDTDEGRELNRRVELRIKN